MQFSPSLYQSQPAPQQISERERQRLVTMALNLTAETKLAPGEQELHLLQEFTRGSLTIDQVLALLETQEDRQAARCYHA
jgi:hypothetical protein